MPHPGLHIVFDYGTLIQARKSLKFGDFEDYASAETKSSPCWGKNMFRVHVEGEVLLQMYMQIRGCDADDNMRCVFLAKWMM